MKNFRNVHHASAVIDREDKTVVSDSHTVQTLRAAELYHASVSWFDFESIGRRKNTTTNTVAKLSELSGCKRREASGVGHALVAEFPFQFLERDEFVIARVIEDALSRVGI